LAVPAKRRAPAAKKTTPRRLIVKGTGASASDADIVAATNASTGHMSNRDQEWFAYEKHPWVRACVRLIANAVSQEGFSVAAIDGATFKTLTEEADPRVKEILQFFRYAFAGRSLRTALVALVTDLEVFGIGYWLKRRQGDLLWYERADPRLMSPVLNPEHTEIVSYIIKKSKPSGVGALLVVDDLSSKKVDAKDVIRFAFEGGDTVFGGPSPLEALDLTVAMDLSIRHHRNSFFRNGATHGTYIICADASEEQVDLVKKSFTLLKAGVSNAYSPIILAGQIEVKKFAESGKNEVDFLKGSELTRDEIAAVYSVPLGKLMFSGGALGSAGKSEDDDTFQRDCVLPIEELIYETLTTEILLKEFEIDDLALIPKRRASVRTDRFPAALQLVKFGGTANEARELAGLPKVDDPKMDEPLFLGAGGATSADPGLTKEDAPAASPSQPAPAASTGKVDGANEATDKKQQNEVASTKAKSRFHDLKRRQDLLQQRAVAAHEGKLAAKLIACRDKFEREFWRLAGDVKAAAAAGATSAAITHTEVLALARAIMDVDDAEYADAIYTASELMAEIGWSQGKAMLDLTTGFDVVPIATLKRLRESANEFGDRINLQEKDALRLAITEAFEKGLSVPQTRDLISETFKEGYHSIGEDGNVERRVPSDSWSTMVARTELSAASNAGMMDLYSVAGVQQIEWIAADSPTTCFPAGELVSTIRGMVPIEDLTPSEQVKTAFGFDQVTRCLTRPFSGTLVSIKSGGKCVIATEDHPFDTERGWRIAINLTLEDRLKTVDNQLVQVDSLMHFSLAETDRTPTHIRKGCVATGILDRAMPISTVDLDCNTVKHDGEISDVFTDSEFLLKRDTERRQRFAHHNLDTGLCRAGSIARSTAVPLVDARTASQSFSASETLKGVNRPTAGFITVLTPWMRCTEKNATSRAWNEVLADRETSAPIGTKQMLVAHSVSQNEGNSALLADALDVLALGLIVTTIRAELSSTVQMASEEDYATLLTSISPRHRAVLAEFALNRYIPVFNVETETTHTYNIEGFVVHNCDDCAELDGQVTNIGEPFHGTDIEEPPFHPNCVCTTSPADSDLGNYRSDQQQQDRAARGGYSAQEYADKFGFDHPLDARREGGAPSGDEDY
jgi:hypothetical protein